MMSGSNALPPEGISVSVILPVDMTIRDWWNLIRGVPSEARQPLPEGFMHPQQDAAYALGGFAPKHGAVRVGEPGRLGARYHVGPFEFETYFCDQEPELSPSSRHRFVIWQPLTRLDVPRGWWRPWAALNARQHGVVSLSTGPQPAWLLGGNSPPIVGCAEGAAESHAGCGPTGEYWKAWSSHAQRHRRKWLRDAEHEIIEVEPDDYIRAYRESGRLPLLREDFVGIINRRRSGHGSHMRLLAVRQKATGRIVAGLGVLDLPDTGQSLHVTAFLRPDAERTSAGYGLIDAWYRQSIEKGLRFLHWGLVHYPGDPRSWKGYSRFKRQFAPTLIVYPNALVRIVRRG